MQISQKEIEGYIKTKKLKNPKSEKSQTNVLQRFTSLKNQFDEESIEQVFDSRFRMGIRSRTTLQNNKSIWQ